MASEVHHGDCLEAVRGLAAESVNLVYVVWREQKSSD